MPWTVQIEEDLAAARWTGGSSLVSLAFDQLPPQHQSLARGLLIEGLVFTVATAVAAGTRRPRVRWLGPGGVVLQSWAARDPIVAGLTEEWIMTSRGGEPAAGLVAGTHRESIPSLALMPDHSLVVDLQGAMPGDSISPLVVHGRLLFRHGVSPV